MRMIFTNNVTLNNKWNNYAIGGIGSRSRAIRRQILTRTGENLQGCCQQSLSPVFANFTGDLEGFGVGVLGLVGQKMCAIKTNNSALPEYIFIGKEVDGTKDWRMVGGSISINADNAYIFEDGQFGLSKTNKTDFMTPGFEITSPSQVIELFNSPYSQVLAGPNPEELRYKINNIQNSSCPTNGIFA